MIDRNLLQTAQRSFDFKGRVAVKSTVIDFKNRTSSNAINLYYTVCIHVLTKTFFLQL